MKIEIDTKHDSPGEIQKVIKMLQHLVGEKPHSSYPNSYPHSKNIFEDPDSFGVSSEPSQEPEQADSLETVNAFMNMFGNSTKETKNESIDDEEEREEEKEEIPRVIPY